MVVALTVKAIAGITKYCTNIMHNVMIGKGCRMPLKCSTTKKASCAASTAINQYIHLTIKRPERHRTWKNAESAGSVQLANTALPDAREEPSAIENGREAWSPCLVMLSSKETTIRQWMTQATTINTNAHRKGHDDDRFNCRHS